MIDTKGQTPLWAAELIVERFFGDLAPGDRLLEPTCGAGAFLRAIPAGVEAAGVELDPSLAEVARQASGRPVITGDITTAAVPFTPTHLIGNPPFRLALIEAILERAWGWLVEGGRCGFILPCATFQQSTTVARLAERWSIEQEMLPRDIFHRVRTHIVFATFRKEALRRLVGFALYPETLGARSLPGPVQLLLIQGDQATPQRPTWRAVAEYALRRLGGRASLAEIYAEVEGVRPTGNRFWREKLRQVLQMHFVPHGGGVWGLPA